jgi:hypothetical protein
VKKFTDAKRTYFGDYMVNKITRENIVIEYSKEIRGKNQDTAELAILEYAVTVRLGNKV